MASKLAKTSGSGGPAMKKPRMEAASWSFTEKKPDTHYDHVWSIANFSTMMEMPSGERLFSGRFSFMVNDKQTSWKIECYPNGIEKQDAGFLSIYLIYLPQFTELPSRTRFTLSIVNKEGAKSISDDFEKDFDIDDEDKYAGDKRFISHEDLQNVDLNLLPDDELTIHCAVTVYPEEEDQEDGDWKLETVVTSGTSRPLLSEVSRGDTEEQARFAKCLEDSYVNGQFTDCVVICQGREFKCHKVVLAGRSPVFSAMLTHDMEENRSGRIEIKDLDVDTMDSMLSYIYSGKIGNMDGKEEMLLAAGEKYNLPGLKALCEDALSRVMNIDNALDMLLVADLHKAENVKDLALKFIVENAQEIVSQDDCSKKLEKFPSILLDMFKASIKNHEAKEIITAKKFI